MSDTEVQDINIEDIEEVNYDAIENLDIDHLAEGRHCMHNNTIVEANIERCVDCGLELTQELSLEPEWRNYDNNDKGDPSRCHIRKDESKSIFKDLEAYELPKEIMRETNDLYFQVTNGKILRANNRKSMIYACLLDVYKRQPNPAVPEDLAEKFKLTRKDISKGCKDFKLSTNKSRKNVHMSPMLHIDRIMAKFDASREHVDQVKVLYDKIKNRNTILNRSHQQSVMSGLIYYYWKVQALKDKTYDISGERYSSIVKLSLITINKIARIVSQLLGTTDRVKL